MHAGNLVLIDDPSPALLEQVYRLRVVAWRARVPTFPDIDRWTDDFDAEARHFIIMADDAPVAAARLTIHISLADAPDTEVWRDLAPGAVAPPIGFLSRAVVHPDFSGRGLAQQLDDCRVAAARTAGCRACLVSSNSGLARVRQLAAAGFVELGTATAQASGPLAGLAPPRRLVMRFEERGGRNG